MRFDGKTNPQVATSLKIEELSGVTVPAHTGADVAIIKLGQSPLCLKSVFDEVLADEQLEQRVREWLDPLWNFNYALRESIEDVLKDDNIFDKAAAVRENVQSYMRQVIGLIDKQPQPEANNMADNTELELYKALAQMTDAQKAHYQSLPEAEKSDFLKLDGASRDLIVKSATVADESHTMADGTVISKSSAGAMFAVLKSQDAQLRKMQAEQDLAKAVAQTTADFGNLPGEPMAKAKAVMGLNALDAATRTWVTDTLKTADGLYKARREPAGDPASVDTGDNAGDKLETLAKTYAETHKVSHAVAFSKVIDTVEGRALYNKSLEG